MAGLPVDDAAIRSGLAFVESKMSDEGRIGYQTAGAATVRANAKVAKYLPKLSESLTAAGLSVLAHSETLNSADPRVKAGIRLVLGCPPAWTFKSRTGAVLTE